MIKYQVIRHSNTPFRIAYNDVICREFDTHEKALEYATLRAKANSSVDFRIVEVVR